MPVTSIAGGYCTFNGLMVTAAVLLAEGKRFARSAFSTVISIGGTAHKTSSIACIFGDRMVHYTPMP
jgi:hypothetical protein